MSLGEATEDGVRIGKNEINAPPNVDMGDVGAITMQIRKLKAEAGLLNGISQESFIVCIIHEFAECMASYRVINGDEKANLMLKYLRAVMVSFEEIEDEVREDMKKQSKDLDDVMELIGKLMGKNKEDMR